MGPVLPVFYYFYYHWYELGQIGGRLPLASTDPLAPTLNDQGRGLDGPLSVEPFPSCPIVQKLTPTAYSVTPRSGRESERPFFGSSKNGLSLSRSCKFAVTHRPSGTAINFCVIIIFRPNYSFSNSSSHNADTASDGIRQSPRGERLTLPTFGPSGTQERLNCWEKKRR